jgi:mono/diheme cytochrome c family protein
MRLKHLLVAVAVLAVSVQFVQAQSSAAASIEAERLYQENCSVCHGDKGDGKSRAATNLQPHPRDFTAPQAAVELTHERIVTSIREGRAGTAMAPWKGQLSPGQIDALATFIRGRFLMPMAYDASNEGRQIYAESCSVCHGDKGNGISRASSSLVPPPRNFTSAAARSELTRERMIFSVTYGRANTAMAGWDTQLNQVQVAAVVDYIQTAFMNLRLGAPGGSDGLAGSGSSRGSQPLGLPGGNPAAYFAEKFPRDLTGNRDNGQALYLVNCVPCHGINGDGRGPRAYFIMPRPRDFSHPAARASLNRTRLFGSIGQGIVGSEMSAWEKVLSAQQIADIGEYVLKAFIRPGSP